LGSVVAGESSGVVVSAISGVTIPETVFPRQVMLSPKMLECGSEIATDRTKA
jgi:hypothetical protein